MLSPRLRLVAPLLALALAAAGCSAGADAPPSPGVPGGQGGAGGDGPVTPGTSVETKLPEKAQEELDAIENELALAAGMTAKDFAQKYHVPFASQLPYDPLTAQNLPLLQGSSLALDPDEMAAFGQHGFVISERQRFPTFVYGYQTLYADDLPVFISADSILYAVHKSYDDMLKAIELASLIPELGGLLDGMRAALAAGGAQALGDVARADADLYLAVAGSLLRGELVLPFAGGDPKAVAELYDGALKAEGWKSLRLFDVDRDIDFSQFKPRGHYTDAPELERYFRSMMWLGRIDLRLLETQPDHTQLFHRRQLEAALALRQLMDAASISRWSRIDAAIRAFVGEPDSMSPPQLDGLLQDLGIADVAALAAVPDAVIAQAIVDGGYGTQRISSHIMINGLGAGTMPLSSSFLLFGQRYVLDSHVFSNVVYDRVQDGKVMRMMPDPLDAAFAALDNDHAGTLLLPQLEQHGYARDLHMMRVLADLHGPSFWEANLYNLWLESLRALSPGPEVASPAESNLPALAATEPWARRVLNTQLASWAELRHDTILYAKQSYTGGATCEFPDAYVEPSPAFFQKLEALAQRGQELVGTLDLSAEPYLAAHIEGYFGRLGSIAARLGAMAEHQRTGAPFTQEQMDFINQAVVVEMGCGEPAGASGWYPQLFFSVHSGLEFDPTIADVHTQPTDEGGTPVGRVLHVGTGSPRLFVVSFETCTGPRAYAGLASSYFERVTEDFVRLDDEAWAAELAQATPDDVVWMKDLVVR